MAELVKVENNQVVSSSRVVAENFGKRHDHILRDIENFKKDVPNFGEMFYESTAPDKYGREKKIYYLNKKGFMLLVMGFNGAKAIEMKMRFLDRFEQMEEELRNKNQIALPSNYKEALLALVEAEEVKEQLQLEVKIKEQVIGELKPDAEFAQEYINIDDEKGLVSDTVAKKLGLTANVLNSILLKQKFIRKSGGSYTMMQNHAMKGYETYSEYKNHFTEIVYKNIRWTHKGEKKIFEILKNLGYVMPDEVDYRYNEYGIKEISECYGLKYSDVNNILELEGVIKKGKQGYKLTDEFSNLGYKNNTKWTEHGKRLIKSVMEKHQKV